MPSATSLTPRSAGAGIASCRAPSLRPSAAHVGALPGKGGVIFARRLEAALTDPCHRARRRRNAPGEARPPVVAVGGGPTHIGASRAEGPGRERCWRSSGDFRLTIGELFSRDGRRRTSERSDQRSGVPFPNAAAGRGRGRHPWRLAWAERSSGARRRARASERSVQRSGVFFGLYDDGVEEIIFVVTQAPEGGYTARALGEAIFTEADDTDSLREQVRDAVRCHFEEGQAPKVVRLHFVHDDVIAV